MPPEWETFYFMIGSSAAGLIGLLFVVVTLTPEVDPARVAVGQSAYVSPTVYHFASVLLVSAVSVMPETPAEAPALAAIAVGSVGFILSVTSLVRFVRGTPSAPHWSDYIYYCLLPGIAHLGLIAGAVALWLDGSIAVHMIAVSALGLLLLGIRDAWDLVTYLSSHRKG